MIANLDTLQIGKKKGFHLRCQKLDFIKIKQFSSFFFFGVLGLIKRK
jgi:hypothetical protein